MVERRPWRADWLLFHQVVRQERPGSKSIVAADTRHDLLAFLDAKASPEVDRLMNDDVSH